MDFSNIEARLQEGREIIADAGAALTIDGGKLEDGNTLAICTLVEWSRYALEKNCHLSFVNVPPRLHSLIDIYQLGDLLLSPPRVEAANKALLPPPAGCD